MWEHRIAPVVYDSWCTVVRFKVSSSAQKVVSLKMGNSKEALVSPYILNLSTLEGATSGADFSVLLLVDP